LRKAQPELCSLEKSEGEGSFGLVLCLDGAAGAGEGGIARGGDTGIGGRATAGCEGDQSRALQEISQFKLYYKICYNSPPGDSSEN